MTDVIRTSSPTEVERPLDDFVRRHIGPRAADIPRMLETIGCSSLEELIGQTIPAPIRLQRPLALDPPRTEHELMTHLRDLASRNRVFRSFLGMGYSRTIVPPVIQRNILENPGWYTQYTAYQSEISQGRLEALLNFQTMVADLTGLPLANASLLDEATAAAEAMNMCWAIDRAHRTSFFVAEDCHPQTIEVLRTRARPRGLQIVVGPAASLATVGGECFGALLQVPATDGRVYDPKSLIEKAHAHGTLVVVAADILALTLLEPPGEQGADIAVGSTQRFGVPMGLGGPHAAYLATRDEHKRHMPGRIIGVSLDARGKPAYRLAMQTREQHIRRDKATSNICTAQALLAVMASMYAIYHGPRGLRAIAERTHRFAQALASGLAGQGHRVVHRSFFDTVKVVPVGLSAKEVRNRAHARGINLREFDDGALGIALDEPTSVEDLTDLLLVFGASPDVDVTGLLEAVDPPTLDALLLRTSGYLAHPVFHRHHSEHEMLRYMHRLQSRDLSLTTSMIPLGSCTMKLNGTTEMLPVTWPEFGELHPFAPREQWAGYVQLFEELEAWLAEITGFTAVSLQPNAGAQGEYAGLMVIRAYHESRGDLHRDACLIPVSAHGTNPASAVMAGMQVVVVACDESGNVDVDDLRAKATEHGRSLAALMITYPSTHGVFEESIQEICSIVHQNGGQVYMDGANMNAQVGLCRPGDMGADVCHLNLHKTFCIPHGGGGPGMGPIGVAAHLAPFLPGHPSVEHGPQAVGPVAAAPYGSPSILPISWVYIALMGASGLQRASQVAILNANYMAKRLEGAYDILYTGPQGRVAHEFVLDLRPFKTTAGIDVTDVAKRLMDFGFHAPTMSWPVAGTLMIEPTESESKEELDRFCEAMLTIRAEIAAIESGEADREDNVLRNSPHTVDMVIADAWSHPYSREQAAYPLPWLREFKFWPSVARVDNAYGDRHLVCTCPLPEDFA